MMIRKIFCKSLGFQLLLLSAMGILGYNVIVSAEDVEDWMPDPALREVVRETLSLSGLKTPSTKVWESLMSKTLHTQFLTTDNFSRFLRNYAPFSLINCVINNRVYTNPL